MSFFDTVSYKKTNTALDDAMNGPKKKTKEQLQAEAEAARYAKMLAAKEKNKSKGK